MRNSLRTQLLVFIIFLAATPLLVSFSLIQWALNAVRGPEPVTASQTANMLALLNAASASLFVAAVLFILLAAVLAVVLARRITKPIEELTTAAAALKAGDYSTQIAVTRQDEIGALAAGFNALSTNLQKQLTGYEQRLAELMQDINLAAGVAQNVTHIKELPRLLQQTVDLIRTHYQVYYAQIYLTDENGEYLVLRAGTGEAGAALLARAHRLPINNRSINGQAALTKEVVLVQNVRQNPLFRPNPFLPHTLSEMAIPILSGERVIGVLNIQDDETGKFSEDSIPALAALAGQLAIAIDNATLFADQQQIEAELARFKLGIERSPSAIFLTDVQGKILYVNPAFTELYGWSAAEAIGQTPRILKSGVIPSEQYAYFWQTLLNKEVVAGEIVNKAKDGRFLTIEGSNNPIISESGQVIGFLSIHTDITQRKNAEIGLARMVAELNCLNDIGRKVEEQPAMPDFLAWVAQRIPAAMPNSEQCVAAITLAETVYGDPAAMSVPRHIVEGLRIGDELVGRLYLAYADARLTFVDEDSAFIGGICRRVSSYLQSRHLLEQVQKRAIEMQAVAHIGTAVAGSLDAEQLLQDVANLTKERFNLYHAQIFLLDKTQDVLVLAAGAGDVGKQMVAEGQRILVMQEQFPAARAARLRQGVIVNDLQAVTGFVPHPLLPDARAELAVPLLARDAVQGVLTVQADQAQSFAAGDIYTLTTLATQLSAALQNAQQFAQTQQALEELQALQKRFVREAWRSFLADADREVQGYLAAGKEVKPIVRNGRLANEDGVTLQELVKSETAVVQPVLLGETPIGGLGVRLPQNGKLSPQQHLLLQALTKEVSLALERARLAEQTQIALSETEQRTHELAILNEMGRAFTADLTIDAIIDSIHIYTRQLINTEDMYVALYDAELDEVDIRIFGVGEERSESALVRRGGRGITEYVIRNREPLLISTGISAELAEDLGIELGGRDALSWLGVPMVVGEEIVGMLAVQDFTESYRFDMHSVDLLTTVANQAAIAIQNIRLFSQTQSRARQEQILRQVSTRVNAAVDPDAILRTAVQEVGRALGLETFVYLTEKNRPEPPAAETNRQNGH